MKRPTVLIGGGYDKGSEYTEWINSFDGKVKKLILLGDTKEKIAADAEKCGFKDYMFVDSFEEAVLTAAKLQSQEKQFCFHLHVQAGICSRVMKYVERSSKKL